MARNKECVNRTELIICAAHELFSRYGFERTTIDDIARQAGIGKGSVYIEFQNKDEILMAVISRFVERKNALMQAHFEQAASPYLEALKQMLIESIMCSYDAITAHMHTPEALVHTSRKVKAGFKDHFLLCQNLIEQYLEKANTNGELADLEEPAHYAELIMLSCSGLVPPYVQYRIPTEDEIPARARLEQDAKDLLAVLIEGLKTRKSVKR